MVPNTRAMERLEGVESKLKSTEKEFESKRRQAKRAKDDFEEVKERRFELFSKAFTHISEQIGPVYKDLTKSSHVPLGGQAYVTLHLSYLALFSPLLLFPRLPFLFLPIIYYLPFFFPPNRPLVHILVPLPQTPPSPFPLPQFQSLSPRLFKGPY